MRTLISLMLPLCLVCSCSSTNLYYDPMGIDIEIYGISKEEALVVVGFVYSNFENLKGEYFHESFRYDYLQSIGKWKTPGKPTELDLKCLYSINFYKRPGGDNLCLGHDDKTGEFKVLTSVTWIH